MVKGIWQVLYGNINQVQRGGQKVGECFQIVQGRLDVGFEE